MLSLVPRPLFSVFIKTEKSGLGMRLGYAFIASENENCTANIYTL